MSGRFLLDTNIVIALMSGERAALSHLENAEEVLLPATALGELFYGAAKSRRPAENLAVVEKFASGRAIVACDLGVAREYGLLKQQLRGRGRPIPENDLWIAAAAKRHGVTLVSRDSHFADIDGIEIASWTSG